MAQILRTTPSLALSNHGLDNGDCGRGSINVNDYLDLLSKRQEFSKERLNEIRSEVLNFEILNELSDLCIYVTGSFGRLEASTFSDIDLFFVHRGQSVKDAVPRINKILLDADLIKTAKKLGFPDFSNDGEYLSIHYLEDIKKTLGGRDDDFKNHFTARLLLLLESRSIHNEEVYDFALQYIIDCYYRDYHDHDKNFRPVFLINDIIRFWRTLCLNYEHKRNRPSENDDMKFKSHIANFKLKFSRLLTCHSAIALLSIDSGIVNQDELLRIVKLSPLERLDEIDERKGNARDHIRSMKEEYVWFLDKTSVERQVLFDWMADRDNREQAFEKGRTFATHMYKTLQIIAGGDDIMRYLVV